MDDFGNFSLFAYFILFLVHGIPWLVWRCLNWKATKQTFHIHTHTLKNCNCAGGEETSFYCNFRRIYAHVMENGKEQPNLT